MYVCPKKQFTAKNTLHLLKCGKIWHNNQKGKPMKRSDMIRTIQVQFGQMQTNDATAILDTISDFAIESVANGNKIEIRGFGTFQPRMRAARVGYNPASGKSINLAPSKTILFKPSRELTNKMNG